MRISKIETFTTAGWPSSLLKDSKIQKPREYFYRIYADQNKKAKD